MENIANIAKQVLGISMNTGSDFVQGFTTSPGNADPNRVGQMGAYSLGNFIGNDMTGGAGAAVSHSLQGLHNLIQSSPEMARILPIAMGMVDESASKFGNALRNAGRLAPQTTDSTGVSLKSLGQVNSS